jgi:hypothetical protein
MAKDKPNSDYSDGGGIIEGRSPKKKSKMGLIIVAVIIAIIALIIIF